MDSTSETESSSATSRSLAVEFKGDGWEYFKIWLVNVLLTMTTLGIYSARAKVKTKREMIALK